MCFTVCDAWDRHHYSLQLLAGKKRSWLEAAENSLAEVKFSVTLKVKQDVIYHAPGWQQIRLPSETDPADCPWHHMPLFAQHRHVDKSSGRDLQLVAATFPKAAELSKMRGCSLIS